MRHTPFRYLCGVLVVVGLCSASASAQTLGVLRDIEQRLLDKRIDEFEVAHALEGDAARALSGATQRLFSALGNGSVRVDRLRQLESEVSLAREAHNLKAREATDLRQDIYSRMERLEELDRELARGGGRLTGRWFLDFGGGSQGVITFYSYGGRVEGFYDLEDGRRGALRGTMSGNEVSLERIDVTAGLDRNLVGTLSQDGATIRGTWRDRELASGRPATGRWGARRLVN